MEKSTIAALLVASYVLINLITDWFSQFYKSGKFKNINLRNFIEFIPFLIICIVWFIPRGLWRNLFKNNK